MSAAGIALQARTRSLSESRDLNSLLPRLFSVKLRNAQFEVNIELHMSDLFPSKRLGRDIFCLVICNYVIYIIPSCLFSDGSFYHIHHCNTA